MAPLLLALVPGIFRVLESVLGDITDVAKVGMVKGFGALETLSSSGIIGVVESLLGNIESSKKALIQAQIEDLIAQTQVIEAEISSPKPFWMIPHELAEFGSVAYLMGCILPRLVLQLTTPFGLVFSVSPMDSTLIYICVGVLGLIRSYKALAD